MSYNDDPNINRRERIVAAERSNTGMWIAGAVAVCLVVGLIAFATTQNSKTAMDINPAATTRAPASTTGSGAVTSGTDTPSQPARPLPNPNAPAAPAQR